MCLWLHTKTGNADDPSVYFGKPGDILRSMVWLPTLASDRAIFLTDAATSKKFTESFNAYMSMFLL